MWIGNEGGVEIIELNSSTSNSEADEHQENFSHAWSYINQFQQMQDDNYKVNEKARERRRLNEDYLLNINDDSTESDEKQYENAVTDYFIQDNNPSNNEKRNEHINCFTIVNKHFSFNSDSSSDDLFDDEILYNGRSDVNCNQKDLHEEEIVTCGQDFNSEKHTIWIYSFKNKRILSDNDFMIDNRPSNNSSSSSSSLEIQRDIEEKASGTQFHRVPTPIPATFVPRLNLFAAPNFLPTVTEITEPKNEATDKCNQKISNGTQIPINNWLQPNVTRENKGTCNKQDSPKSNVINWMALSPRERKRRSRNTNTVNLYKAQLPVLREVSSCVEKSFDIGHVSDRSEIITTNSRTIDESDRKPRKTIETKKVMLQAKEMRTIPSKDTIYSHDMEDRGDFNKNVFRKPQINPNKPLKLVPITDPLEKLDSDNWIAEETHIESTKCEDNPGNVTKRERMHEDTASDRLFARNMSLLKPSQWSEYLPIVDSPPSIQISINTDTEDGRKSWIRCLAKAFRCCNLCHF